MKHITFDESTVLNEFARIASEQNLVKTADTIQPRDLPPGEKPKSRDIPPIDTKKSLPPDINLGPKKDFPLEMPAADDSVSGPNQIWKDVGDAIVAMQNAETFDALAPNAYVAMEKQILANPILKQKYKSKDISMVFRKLVGAEKRASIKQADSKLYDVSGETGEDLVDSAHPGNTKVSDDVVETIVEQQECDIAIINKVPKGTYASLVELYNKLHKEGHKEVLGELMDVIKAVATPEEIAQHALMTLANELDSRGLVKEADAVDTLLIKIAKTPLEGMRDEIAAAFNRLQQRFYGDQDKLTELKNLDAQLRTMPATSAAQMINQVNKLLANVSVPGVREMWNQMMPRYNVAVESEIAGRQRGEKAATPPAAAPNAAAGKQPAFQPGWEKDSAQVTDFQKKYNDAFSQAFKGKRPLKEDGKYGQHTAAAFKYFQQAGSDFAKLPALLKQIAAQRAKAKKKAPATPGAPAEATPGQTAESAPQSVDALYKQLYEQLGLGYANRVAALYNVQGLGKDQAKRQQFAEVTKGLAQRVFEGGMKLEDAQAEIERIIVEEINQAEQQNLRIKHVK